jgi:hypothetical protein
LELANMDWLTDPRFAETLRALSDILYSLADVARAVAFVLAIVWRRKYTNPVAA